MPYFSLPVLCSQLLADSIKQSTLRGITVADNIITISQLADDTTLFLKDAEEIPKAIIIISIFSKASGLHLNMNKCELLSLKQCDLPSICGIPIKNEVTYLGIKIVKDEERRCELNFSPVIDKTKKKLNHWLLRDLSLRGRVLITKAEGISRLTYTALSLAVNDNICKTIDNMLFNLLWKNKTYYIKKSVIMNTTENGGLNFLNFTTLNYTFKINWIKQ